MQKLLIVLILVSIGQSALCQSKLSKSEFTTKEIELLLHDFNEHFSGNKLEVRGSDVLVRAIGTSRKGKTKFSKIGLYKLYLDFPKYGHNQYEKVFFRDASHNLVIIAEDQKEEIKVKVEEFLETHKDVLSSKAKARILAYLL